ncbi:MAG: Gfo/Idh/MocA family oxidoreductase [Deltaproteobacteria bacterium]|jgi:UDP-2-acetamido-3-amino-2,3-dideoxy-glucuronate N-acetyltransferase|nr:Gfo/Idh/MocA family oxidoreductase [Deltaproteobacteria bacterium]
MTENKLRPQVAVLGAGYWGRNLVRDFNSLGALKMVFDPSRAVRESLVSTYPNLIVADSLEQVLSDGEIEAVAIATPAVTHAELALRCLKTNRDVLVEKPLALKVEDGQEMVEAANKFGRILMVDHLLNRHPAYVELKKMVNDGQLGRILRVWSVRHNFGKIRKDENVSWSFAPHDVAMILGLIGQSPIFVEANGASYLTDGVEDFVEGSLGFANGTTAHISVSWLNPYKDQRLMVIGTEKMAVFNDTAAWEGKLTIYNHKINWKNQTPEALKDEAGRKIPFAPLESLKEQCQTFLECVKNRKRPIDSHGEEALEVMKVLLSLDKALKKSRADHIQKTTEFRESEPESLNFPAALAATPGVTAASALKVGPEVTGQKGQDFFAHSTAVIDDEVKIGSGVKIWHLSPLMSGSEIGPGTNIGQNVVIGPRARIGSNCKIQNNVSVYEGVTLEDDVFCGPSMVFTNVYNPRAFIKRMDELRPTLVKVGASIGANATIVCGHTLGRFCLIGAGSVVASDVLDYALMIGVPARRKGWVCQCGVKLPPSFICPACGKTYSEISESLVLREPDEVNH